MKKIPYFLLLITSILLVAAQKKPSLKETIDFIKPKLTGRIYTTDPYCLFEFNYKTNTVIYSKVSEFMGKIDTTVYTFQLKNINFKNIKYNVDTKFMELQVNNEKDLIEMYENYNGEIRVINISSVSIKIKDEENVNRLRAAFTNAIKLAGGQGEIF